MLEIIPLPTNGRTKENHPCKTGIHATKWPPHAQWARPAGHGLTISKLKWKVMTVHSPASGTPPAHLRPIRRALLSVTDKTGLIDFARTLASFKVDLVSTGGTARTLREAGLS